MSIFYIFVNSAISISGTACIGIPRLIFLDVLLPSFLFNDSAAESSSFSSAAPSALAPAPTPPAPPTAIGATSISDCDSNSFDDEDDCGDNEKEDFSDPS